MHYVYFCSKCKDMHNYGVGCPPSATFQKAEGVVQVESKGKVPQYVSRADHELSLLADENKRLKATIRELRRNK